jgi:hypothetical protein
MGHAHLENPNPTVYQVAEISRDYPLGNDVEREEIDAVEVFGKNIQIPLALIIFRSY